MPRRTSTKDGSLRSATRLERVLLAVTCLIALVIMIGAIVVMWNMDGSSRASGGRLYLAAAAVVLLGVVDTQMARVVRRRYPFFVNEARGFRRYQMVSLAVLIWTAVMLFVLALLLP